MHRLVRSLTYITSLVPFVLLISGCGIYLHNDDFAKQASIAKDGFAKFDLSQKFSDRLARLSDFETAEDKAVAAQNVANRDETLQNLLYPPYGPTTIDNKSGPDGLKMIVSDKLSSIIGKKNLSIIENFSNALHAEEWRGFIIDNDFNNLADTIQKFNETKPANETRSTDCSKVGRLTGNPPGTFQTVDDYYKNIQYLCNRVTDNEHLNVYHNLSDSIDNNSSLKDLIDQYTARLNEQLELKVDTVKLQKEIDDVFKPPTNQETTAAQLSASLKSLQDKLKIATGIAKYTGYKSISDKLDQLLAVELKSSPNGDTTGKEQKTTSSSKGTLTNQAQAAVDLALGLAQLEDIYSNPSSIERVNSLLAAKASASHQMAMAKLDMDFDADMITILNAEIQARIRQIIDLVEVQHLVGDDKGSDFNNSIKSNHMIALGWWVRSQDEGEIPYQVLHMKEVQLLRKKSIKEGQLGAQGYTDLISPMLAELDAYGQGGLTTQTLVQLLGFVGVITSISAK